MIRWFIFDLGNVLIKLAYERVIETVCRDSTCSRDELVACMERRGGYRDLERGEVTFPEFHQMLREQVGYEGDLRTFREVWSDFFDGPIDGIDELLDRVREIYRVAYLSNSNEVHETVIPTRYSVLFRRNEPFFFSHRHRSAKPDAEIYRVAMEGIGARGNEIVYVDDLLENVVTARELGMTAYQFETTQELVRALEADGILPTRS